MCFVMLGVVLYHAFSHAFLEPDEPS
eukprot:COSAG02_NODE_42547_length_383_cov_1.221831_2_plen_25_part_01